MTLCVAAIASEGKGIVAVSDVRFDFLTTCADANPKIARLNKYWAAMYAGDDISNATSLLENVALSLDSVTDANRSDVENLFQGEMQHALKAAIEAEVLSPYNGMTLAAFTSSGYKKLGPETFRRLTEKIEQVGVGSEFLVFGFDSLRQPHIFHIRERQPPRARNAIGYWAIGIGEVPAAISLKYQNYKRSLSLREAAYYLCVAKFMTEDVGLSRETHAVCLMKDGRVIGIDAQAIRRVWERSGRPRLPRNLWKRLPPYTAIEGPLRRSDDSEPPTS